MLLLDEMLAALRVGDPTSAASLNVAGAGELPSYFDVTGLAVASMGAAGLEIARLSCQGIAEPPNVSVDRRLASHWFGWSLRPQGWRRAPAWDELAGDYKAKDGWVRLHTNVPAHRAAALSVVDCSPARQAVEIEVAKRSAEALEADVVAAGGCAAAMRSLNAWEAHPQGRALSGMPLIDWSTRKPCPADESPVDRARPLGGVRVLDLTRILSGPVASRFLAGYGADVLRIDPPGWEEPGVIPEVTLGKRCAGLNLTVAADRAVFESLLATADVLLHGYRADALAGLGYDDETIRSIRPELVDVSLNAYGWDGPWENRRGFDSLVQMSCGIADHGMKAFGISRPRPLPVQALDHATGYLLAAAVISAIQQKRQGEIRSARLSLARVAQLLCTTQGTDLGPDFEGSRDEELDPRIEDTDWGPAKRVRWPLSIDGVDCVWPHPATRLRSAAAAWLD